jgi:hypothetical protein
MGNFTVIRYRKISRLKRSMNVKRDGSLLCTILFVCTHSNVFQNSGYHLQSFHREIFHMLKCSSVIGKLLNFYR